MAVNLNGSAFVASVSAMPTNPQITLDLRSLFILLYNATGCFEMDDMERFLNRVASELQETLAVPRDELQAVFEELDIPLWDEDVEEICGHCHQEDATMPNDMTEHGKLCADCYWFLDAKLKGRRDSV